MEFDPMEVHATKRTPEWPSQLLKGALALVLLGLLFGCGATKVATLHDVLSGGGIHVELEIPVGYPVAPLLTASGASGVDGDTSAASAGTGAQEPPSAPGVARLRITSAGPASPNSDDDGGSGWGWVGWTLASLGGLALLLLAWLVLTGRATRAELRQLVEKGATDAG